MLTALAVVANAVVATPTVGPPVDFELFGPAGFWGVPFLLGVQSPLGWIVFGIVVATLLSIAFRRHRRSRSGTPPGTSSP